MTRDAPDMDRVLSAEAFEQDGPESKQNIQSQPSTEAPGYGTDQDIATSPQCQVDAQSAHGLDLFVHEPLDTTRRQFRLLKLLPGTQDQVAIEMHHFEMESAPSYRAISYVWGSQKTRRPLRVNGKTLFIGQNLYELFQTHGKYLEDTYLWADQIAINQYAIHERNHQVQLEEIYRRADEVIVWLGTALDYTLAVSTLRFLEAKEAFWKLTDVFSVLTEKLDPQCLLALEQLLHNPYWERHWIIQEICLATRAQFLYGTEIMSLKLIHVLHVFSVRRGPVTQMGNIISHHRNRQLSDKSWNWSEAMRMCALSHCEDLRDKVYGIQCLYEAKFRVKVDYSKSVIDVFMDAASTYFLKCRLEMRPLTGIIDLACGMQLTSRQSARDVFSDTVLYDRLRRLHEAARSKPDQDPALKQKFNEIISARVLGTK